MTLVVPAPTVGGHNYVIHGIAGAFAPWVFVWSPSGVIASLIFAVITQAIDTLRLHRFEKNRIQGAPEELRDELLDNFDKGAIAKFGQLYVIKVVWYALFTLAVAFIVRAAGF